MNLSEQTLFSIHQKQTLFIWIKSFEKVPKTFNFPTEITFSFTTMQFWSNEVINYSIYQGKVSGVGVEGWGLHLFHQVFANVIIRTSFFDNMKHLWRNFIINFHFLSDRSIATHNEVPQLAFPETQISGWFSSRALLMPESSCKTDPGRWALRTFNPSISIIHPVSLPFIT